jgi:hypothetical protein
MIVYIVSSCDYVYDRSRGIQRVFKYQVEAETYCRKMHVEDRTNYYFIEEWIVI